MEGRGPALEVRPGVARSGQGVLAEVQPADAVSPLGKAWPCLLCFRAILDMRTCAIAHQSFGKVGFTVLF